jgi:hypothetical protein
VVKKAGKKAKSALNMAGTTMMASSNEPTFSGSREGQQQLPTSTSAIQFINKEESSIQQQQQQGG